MANLISTKLPPEQQRRLHDDFLADDLAYRRMRDDLLANYRGQWVAVRDGRVIASGPDLMMVAQAAAEEGGHPFIARVGAEEIPFRVRRAEAEVDGRRVPAMIQPVDGGQGRIVGREVLNGHCIAFDGPAGRVIFGA